jgi:hypothetical protein|tara:strand:+ start:26 stop:769 length:744 start_codon:yes stop_codon:yes gene_type:complete
MADKPFYEPALQFMFGDPRPDSDTPLLSRMTDEWTDYINYIPGLGLVGFGGKSVIKGGKQVVQRYRNTKNVSDRKNLYHGTNVKNLNELTQSMTKQNAMNFVNSGIYLAGSKNFANTFGKHVHTIPTKNVVSNKPKLDALFNRNKVLDTTSTRNLDADFVKNIQRDISTGKVKGRDAAMLKGFLNKIDDVDERQRYLKELPDQMRQYLISKGYTNIIAKAPTVDEVTNVRKLEDVVISLKDKVKVKD